MVKKCFWALIATVGLLGGCTGEIGGKSQGARLGPESGFVDFDGGVPSPDPADPLAPNDPFPEDDPTCPSASAVVRASNGWQSSPASQPAFNTLDFEIMARPEAANMDALVAVGAADIADFGDGAIKVRFAEDGFIDARDGSVYNRDEPLTYEPGVWYSILVSADIANKTYDVEVGRCGEARKALITGASFESESEVSDRLTTWAAWSSQSDTLDVATPSWMTSGSCAPATCTSLAIECGELSDGCGGTLNCGGCDSGQICADGGVCVDVPPPPAAPPPAEPPPAAPPPAAPPPAEPPPAAPPPAEPPPSTPPPTPGSWPAPGDPLGHRHPECQAIYGKTPAQIEATPCNMPSGDKVPGNSTYSACSVNGVLDFQGSNVTFDCVNWSTGSSTFGTRCEGAPGCENIAFRRTTIKGSNGTAVQNLILLTSRGGQPLRSVLIEKSDISRSDVAILCGSAANGDLYPLPGEGDKALVIRDSWIHGTAQSPTAHTDLMFIAEGCRGVLSERNLWDGSDAVGGANVGSVIQDQPLSPTAGNHVFRNNRFVHDGSGHMFNFDRDNDTSPDVCADPVIFDSNVFDWEYDTSDGFGDTLFNYSTTGRECPRIESRPGSSCTNNKFADGSGSGC